jgi:hypothetical protein
MTLPATGSCGAAGTGTGAEVAADGGGCGGDALDEVDGVEGVADDGRDQPGPVVVDNAGAAVSLVVTSREWELVGGATGRTAVEERHICLARNKYSIGRTSGTSGLDDRDVVR